MKLIILDTTYDWARENKSLDNKEIIEQIIKTIEQWRLTEENNKKSEQTKDKEKT